MSSRTDAFVSLSSTLTAFTEFHLLGTGMAKAYLAALDHVVGEDITDRLLEAFDDIPDGEEHERRKAIRAKILGDEMLGDVARALTKLWYSGTWFELPHRWSERFGPKPNDTTFVVSPEAYVEGLLWKAIGAHPAGARAPGYGSWAAAPIIPSFAGYRKHK
ncbi:hypothetical protein [Agrobacterium larrymoorei]|uniref:Uncharacterized protein n=1 Tax=Agrobacterium larrymoorei TaxID=160699 RepID=A0AAF0HFQ5_9HYPH|nr:hypothetical protein [Agrobacterium larrymoorei]WHA44030.1 hypothetical protein CFBP5477_021670 [Agrobacterium larrymoorei]